MTVDTAKVWRLGVVVAALATLVGCTASDILAGAYETQLSVGEAAELLGTVSDLNGSTALGLDLTGKWRIDLFEVANQPTADERSYYFEVSHGGDMLVRGMLRTAATELTIQDADGSLSCIPVTHAAGHYEWTLRGMELTLVPVDDGCTGRRLVMGKHTWLKVR